MAYLQVSLVYADRRCRFSIGVPDRSIGECRSSNRGRECGLCSKRFTNKSHECYANASECRERAKPTLDAAAKKDSLELEQRWLSLAHKYENAERLAIDSPLSRDGRPDHIGGTALISGLQSTSSRVEPPASRKHLADKLLWQMLERWRRSSPELDRIKFLKTVPFFNELSHRQLKNRFGYHIRTQFRPR
jgi:hypothetical protein